MHSGHLSHLFSARTVVAGTRLKPIENIEKVKQRAMKKIEATRYFIKEAKIRNHLQEYRFYAEADDEENSDEGIGSEVSSPKNVTENEEYEETDFELLVIYWQVLNKLTILSNNFIFRLKTWFRR